MAAELIDALQLGRVPRVVGTIITSEFLLQWSEQPAKLPCDMVELRLDGFPEFSDWIRISKQIEHTGIPVFVTVRLQREGGKWTGGDRERWPMIESAIRSLSGVDVELQSDLAPAVSELCGQLGKLSVFSFHDFEKTPPREELELILRGAERLGGIGKIAATANSLEDVELLRSMLQQRFNFPVCVIGMGPFGRDTRLRFPLEGSCFTYGYLDTPGAPGQYSASELMEHFRRR
ncbi:MAG TPA: type I 3-dehydroquinate dehydratase [Candidatus Kapabacteria bacterium]|nr:type I 3-dehydroquinate dehydratase [Candidatus Kapabacteria bacterium]